MSLGFKRLSDLLYLELPATAHIVFIFTTRL